MSMDDNDGQMIFGDHGGLKLPDICLTGEEKPRKNLTQETCPDRGSNPGPLCDKRTCYHLLHSDGHGVSEVGVGAGERVDGMVNGTSFHQVYCRARSLWGWRLVSTMSWQRLGVFGR